MGRHRDGTTIRVRQKLRRLTHADSNDAYLPSNEDGHVFSDDCLDWLLDLQRTEPNSVTEVSAGGWASSDAAGALPNTSATAGVLLALVRSHRHTTKFCANESSVPPGEAVVWLLELAKRRRRLGHVLSRRFAASPRRKRHGRHRTSRSRTRRVATRLANRHERAKPSAAGHSSTNASCAPSTTDGNISNRTSRPTAASFLSNTVPVQ